MPLITLLVMLIVVGVLLWIVETIIPMDATMKLIIRVVVLLIVVIWLLQVFGLLPAMNVQVPRLR